MLLGPTVNLQRTPLGGRHFECFSEDPVLTAELAVAYVEGLQGAGVAACVKHLVANDQEHDRFEVSSEPDERTLREVSLLPFEHALRGAGAWSTMAAYNRLHGTHCSQHERLLTTILRDEWGWDGVVISDWFAVHATVEPALAGLDLEMPGPPLHWGAALAAAVDAGEVPVEVIEAKRERLALLGRRTGRRPTRPPATRRPAVRPRRSRWPARRPPASFVLLRNDGRAPAAARTCARVAVVGPNGDREVIQGGGSARVTPTDVATVADGLRERLGDAASSSSRARPPAAARRRCEGADLRRADGTAGRRRGDPRRRRRGARHGCGPATSGCCSSTTPATRRGRGLVGPGDRRPSRRGRRVRTGSRSRRTARRRSPSTARRSATRSTCTAGRARASSSWSPASTTRASGWPPSCGARRPSRPTPSSRRWPPPRDADVAVVVVGLDGDWETEGRDRESLDLPGRQVELIEAVAAVQPRTVVVVLAGSPVDLSWAASVPALLWGWLPGQEGGRAVADVLFGDAEPGGRLPCTFPARLEDTPSFLDARTRRAPLPGGRVHRAPLVRRPGDRAGVPVRLRPRLHDLGGRHARWRRRPSAPGERGRGARARSPTPATAAAASVVQLYVGDPDASVRRPRTGAARLRRRWPSTRARRRSSTFDARHARPRPLGSAQPARGWPRPASTSCGPAPRRATSASPPPSCSPSAGRRPRRVRSCPSSVDGAVHPIERLRYVARASGADQTLLVRETAQALSAFRGDPSGLVAACRRIVDRHPTSAPLWWLCARVLTSPDGQREAWDAVDEIEGDRTAAELAFALPEDATVCVIGWPELVGEALPPRGDVEVLAVDSLGEGSGLVRRLVQAGIDAVDVPDLGPGRRGVLVRRAAPRGGGRRARPASWR